MRHKDVWRAVVIASRCVLRAGMICLIIAMVVLATGPARSQTESNWLLGIGPTGSGAAAGSPIGIAPWAADGWDGGDGSVGGNGGVYLLLYREHDPITWLGPSGFYPGDMECTPILAGGSKTWGGFYLFALNWTPSPENVIVIAPPREETPPPPPTGYTGHLVLEQVPPGYSGPMDYWLDLTQRNDLPLPIPVVTDPLLGTRFRLTVYAPPVPEPSSLATLALGLVPVALAVRRRRRS